MNLSHTSALSVVSLIELKELLGTQGTVDELVKGGWTP